MLFHYLLSAIQSWQEIWFEKRAYNTKCRKWNHPSMLFDIEIDMTRAFLSSKPLVVLGPLVSVGGKPIGWNDFENWNILLAHFRYIMIIFKLFLLFFLLRFTHTYSIWLVGVLLSFSPCLLCMVDTKLYEKTILNHSLVLRISHTGLSRDLRGAWQ